MSYLVFINYGSAAREEMVGQYSNLQRAVEKADSEAENGYIDDLISVISYDETGNVITHYDTWGYIHDSETNAINKTQIWEY